MKKERETWANKVQVFLSVLGYIIGFGNIWRFPYMVYENGGGAFLIPYSLCAVLIGFPLFFLETALGQFMKRGAFDAWNIVPIAKGIGLGTVVVAVYCNIYYIIIMVWAILYFFATVTNEELPWTTCGNWWNTHGCIPYNGVKINDSVGMRSNETWLNDTMVEGNSSAIGDKSTLAVMEFWNHYVLRKSGGLENMGSLDNWPLFLSFVAAWAICYFSTFKGVKSTGKVVYITATLPYIFLLVLFVRGCLLPGAIEGVIFYLKPNITKLAEPQVWVDAAGQIVFSYGLCATSLITFASFNDFQHNCFRHTTILVVCCSITSFVGGFAIFTVVGHMAHVQNTTVENLPLSGPGLAFLAYPTALSLMPVPRLWCGLFFFMLILLGIDTEFATLEGVRTVIVDRWPRIFMKKYRQEMLVGCLCLLYFLCGIPFVTEGGIYLFDLFNFYAASGIALLSLAMMESIAIGHIYGIDRFFDDVQLMIGYRPPLFFKICIKYIVPVLTGSIVIFYFAKYAPLKVGGYVYSAGAQALGWILCLSSILCIPGYAIYRVWSADGPGIKKKLQAACRPVYTNHIMEYKEKISSNRGDCDETVDERCSFKL